MWERHSCRDRRCTNAASKDLNLKHHEYMFVDITAWNNLWLAYRLAARGKRRRGSAAGFEHQVADRLIALQTSLHSKTYCPGAYCNFYIHEPKRRKISAAPFRDRVVHHALCCVIEPVFERRFIAHSYANRSGKGTHRAPVYFPGDDLFAVLRPRGLPIGNLTSQFWSNVYMNDFDWFVQRELGCGAYLRYVDDFVLFSNSKRKLWAWKQCIIDRLAQDRLTIHDAQAQVLPTHCGIPWLGFVVYPTHRLLKRRNAVNFTRRLMRNLDAYRSGHISFGELDASVQGWINHVRYADTWGLREHLFSTHTISGAKTT